MMPAVCGVLTRSTALVKAKIFDRTSMPKHEIHPQNTHKLVGFD
jgi:hypothetical protein